MKYEKNEKHQKYAQQVSLLAESIGATPELKNGEMDDLEYFYKRLRHALGLE